MTLNALHMFLAAALAVCLLLTLEISTGMAVIDAPGPQPTVTPPRPVARPCVPLPVCLEK